MRARVWMKSCVSTDVGTLANWFTFEPDPDYSPDAEIGLLSPISYKHCYAEFYVGKIPRVLIGGSPLHRGVVLKWFYSLSRRNTRYMHFTECPSSCYCHSTWGFPKYWNPTRHSVL